MPSLRAQIMSNFTDYQARKRLQVEAAAIYCTDKQRLLTLTLTILTALLLCVVVGITDGDTLTARCATDMGSSTLQVRLAQIDAPEKAQPFGARSREHLASICFDRRAEVVPIAANHGLDRYGRTVAQVNCAGRDANAEQVNAGMAWVFDRYVVDRSLYQLQESARAERRGLWSDPHPMAPWEWRRTSH